MLLSSVSKVNSKRVIFSTRNLRCERPFSLLPYFRRHIVVRLIKYRRKGVPGDPFRLHFVRAKSGQNDAEARIHARKWEVEVKNGVVSEKSSVYTAGKGWVDVNQTQPEVRSHKDTEKPSEEFEIDLITLRRVPKVKPKEQKSHAHKSEKQKPVNKSSETPLPPAVPPPPPPNGLGETKAEKSTQKNHVVSESSDVQSKSSTKAAGKIKREALKVETAPETVQPESKTTPKDRAKSKAGDPPELPKSKLKPEDATENVHKSLDANTSTPKAKSGAKSSPVTTPVETPKVDLDSPVPSNAPLKPAADKTPQKLSQKSPEPPAAEGSSNTKKTPKSTPPVNNTNASSAVDSCAIRVPAPVIDSVSEPVQPKAENAPVKEVPNPGKSAKDTALSSTEAPPPTPPTIDSKAKVAAEARPADPPSEPKKTPPFPPSNPEVASPTKPVSAKITANDTPEESRDVAPPPPKPSAEPLKYHKLNIPNRPESTLDSTETDLDFLLPSDIRAAAGAPGKTLRKVEGDAEKIQRRAKMLADFEAADKQRKLSEGIEGLRAERLSGLAKGKQAEKSGGIEGSGIKDHMDVSTVTAAGTEEAGRAFGDKEDFAWSGTENVSTEDVLGTLDSTQVLESTTPHVLGRQATLKENAVTHKFFVLVRDPEFGHMQFSALPRGVVSDAMVRENTAFDSLQGLHFPGSFLPLWRVLQKGGFTVVGGEKDCLVVKVEADAAKEQQELVMKEIRLKLSPAEAVAREGWERRRGISQSGAQKFETVENGPKENVEAVIPAKTLAPQPAVPPEVEVSTQIPTPETAVTHEEAKVLPKEESTEEGTPKQTTKPRKKRAFRRVFWAAVWVAACSGAVNVALEEYL